MWPGKVSVAAARATLQSIGGSANILDLDADKVTLATGSNVVTWPDQSGRGNSPTMATSGNQPTQVLNDLDGHAAVQFTSASVTKLVKASGFTGISAGDKPRWYAVASFANTNSNNKWIFEITDFGSGTYNRCFLFLATISQIRSRHSLGAGGVMSDSLAPTQTTAVKLWDGQILSDASVLSVNGVASTPSSATTGGLTRAPTGLTVGVGPDLGGTGPLDGKIHRLAVFNPAPDAATHAAIMAYFKGQYPSLGLP